MTSGLLRDPSYGFRQLRKIPGVPTMVVLKPALGIRVNAARAAVNEAALLRSLPFRQPDQIVQMSGVSPQDGATPSSSLPDVRDWRTRTHSLQDIGGRTVGIRRLDVPWFSRKPLLDREG